MPEPPVSRILFPCKAGTAIIHLVPGSPPGSSSLPKSIGRAALHPLRETLFYLTLLRVGFAMPSLLPGTRCALTAPFHPYLETRRYIFCCTFRRVAPPSRYEAHCPVEFGLSSTFLEPRLPGRLRRNYSMLEYRGRPSHSLNFPGSISSG
jgi:hypothetical protein